MQKQIGAHVEGDGPDAAPRMSRHTFVIHVHADGPSTLENLGTRERVAVFDLSTVGPTIERWLGES